MIHTFQGKTVLITGASRGIGKAIALKLAAAGANIVIAAKSIVEDERLGGTIFSAADEVEAAGGKSLAIQCDIRKEEQIIKVVASAKEKFGGIDVLINNASAISLSGTAATEAKRFDLMQAVNVRGTFLVTKHCLPLLEASGNGHILTLSPPLDLQPEWLAPHIAYTLTKYSMSMMTLAWAKELEKRHIAANSLWPVTTIATAAVQNLLGGDFLINRSRKPAILADAAFWILSQDSRTCSGNLFLDEAVLEKAGITDLGHYSVNPGGPLQTDLYVHPKMD